MTDQHIAFATVQPKNGTVTIPAQLRRQFGLDKPGAQVEIVLRDGEIVLVPHIAVPADQAWFWTPEWQAKEREVDEDVAAGRRSGPMDAAAFLTHLDALDAKAETAAAE